MARSVDHFPRANDLIYGNAGPRKVPHVDGDRDSDEVARQRYLWSLRSDAPNAWYSDHLRESQRGMRGVPYIASEVLQKQASTAELEVYKWKPDAKPGEEEESKELLNRSHRISQLMLHPNVHDSLSMFLRRGVQQLCFTGEWLAWRVDDGYGIPAEMWNVPTGEYQPVPISSTWPDGAYRVMPYFPGPLSMVPGGWNQGGVIVDATQMIAVRMAHPLVNNVGLSPMSACDLEVDAMEAIPRAWASILKRMPMPGAIVETDPQTGMPEGPELFRIQNELYNAYSGADRAGSIAVLSPGMKLQPTDPKDRELGFEESWDRLLAFAMAIWGMNKSVAMMGEEASYATLYASLQQFNLFTMVPLLQLISDAFNRYLIWPFWGREYGICFKPKPVNDEQMKQGWYKMLMEGRACKVKELRGAAGLKETGEARDDEWVGEVKETERVNLDTSNDLAGSATGGTEGRGEEKEVSKSRPKNEAGKGTGLPQAVERNGHAVGVK